MSGHEKEGLGRETLGLDRAQALFLFMLSSAVSYSPTTLRLQYHRRCQA
jgi:hypothetical protein